MTAVRKRGKQIRNRGKQKLAANGQSPSQPRVGGPGAAAAVTARGRADQVCPVSRAGRDWAASVRAGYRAPPPPRSFVLIGHAASFTPY